MKLTTATQRYRAISLAFLRFLSTASGGEGRTARAACNTILECLGNPDTEPTPSEARWLKVLDALIAAELGDGGGEEEEEEEEP